LAKIGQLYGEKYHKKDIGSYRKGKISALLKENKDLFMEYALQDSKITLKHVNSMEEFYVTVGMTGVPLTLSGVGKAYVKQY